MKGKRECWTCATLEQVGTVLRESNYKAGVTYLAEYKHMLVEAGEDWSHQLQRAFSQVSRALKRAKGPAKKAAEVEEDRWMEACRKEFNEVPKGTIHRPALMFAVATVWMMREERRTSSSTRRKRQWPYTSDCRRATKKERD